MSAESTQPPEHEVTKEQETLSRQGEIVTFRDTGLVDNNQHITIRLGDKSDARGKTLNLLKARVQIGDTHEEIWAIIDPGNKELPKTLVTEALMNGVPYVVGRENTVIFPYPDQHPIVSRKHVTIIPSERLISIVQQGGNPTYFEAPKGTKYGVVKLEPPHHSPSSTT